MDGPLLAKPRQSLVGHSQDTLTALRHLLDQEMLAEFCRRWGLERRAAWLSMALASLLHDWGKATRLFQEAVAHGQSRPDFPHALAALPLVRDVWRCLGLPSLVGDGPLLEALAVVGHHTPLHAGLYRDRTGDARRLGYAPETGRELDRLLDWAARQLGEPVRPLGAWPVANWGRITMGQCVEALHEGLAPQVRRLRGEDDTGAARLRALYTFLAGHLKAADQWASRHLDDICAASPQEGVLEALAPPDPGWHMPPDAWERVWASLPRPYPFQRRLAEVDSPQVVVMAPCGRGKTEGALLWALGQWRRGRCRRIVLAMPTQVTSNAMRERLASLFGEERVGLYHGRSSLEHRELARLGLAQGDGAEDLDPRQELELARDVNYQGEVFLRPITVTTVDHVLYTFVHGYRSADMALGLLQTAAIVFDEVHYYDRRMLAELRELFRILRLMQVPHLLMSGTLPRFLLEEARLRDYEQVTDEEGLGRRPFYLRLRREPLVRRAEGEASWAPQPQAVEEIACGYREGKAQFVIVNTVGKAQALYRALREALGPRARLWCLHSRFTYEHRRRKEREVMAALRRGERPLLLVATQVIEVSLDISCQRMFSELCPMDALGQRAGRLHRGGATPAGHELVVFPVAEPHPYLQGRQPMPALARTWELLQEGMEVSYGWLRQACDDVYHDATLGVAQLPDLFRECTLFGPRWEEVRFSEEEGRLYRPRQVSMPTIDVIPQAVVDELGEEGISPSYLAPVPVWWVGLSNRERLGLFVPHQRGSRTWLVCQVPYDREIGFHEEAVGRPPEGVVVD